MRSLNVRFLAILVGLGVVLAISVFALHRYQVYSQANFRYKMAQRTKDSDDPEKRVEAVKNLQRYLNLRPDDNTVRAELGELLADIAEKGGPEYRRLYGSAFFEFEQVLRENPTLSDVRRKLVEVTMATGRFADAQEHVEVLLQDFPDDAEVFMWMGQCRAHNDKNEEAIDFYKRALEKSPQQIETYPLLARLLSKDADLGEDRDLNPTVKETVAVAGKKQEAEKSSGATEAPADKPDKTADLPGEKTTDKAATAAKKAPQVKIVEKEDENHPDTWMNRLVKANPNSPQALLLRGQYLQKTRKPEEARQDAVEAIKCMPKAMAAIAGSLNDTSSMLKKLADALPSAPASSQKALEELASAAARMEKASADAAGLAKNEDCKAVEENVEAAFKAVSTTLKEVGKTLSEIAAEKEEDENIISLLASVAKSKARAEEDFKSANDSLLGALLLIAESQADEKEEGNAFIFAGRALKLFPHSPVVYSVLSQLESAKGDSEASQEWVDRGLEATGDAPELLWRKANFLIDDLGKSGISEKQKNSILTKLDLTTDKLRASASIYRIPAFTTYLSAREAFVQGKWAEASKLFGAIRDDLSRMSPRLAMQSEQMAAVCYNQLGRPELAKEASSRARRAPGAIAGRFGKIAKMLSQGKVDEAKADLDELNEEKKLPDEAWVILAQNNLGINRAREKSKQDWDTFNKVLQLAKENCADDSRLAIIEADALVAQEKADEAENLLTAACQKDPKEFSYWQALLRVAQHKGDWELADRTLAQAREQFGDTANLRMVEAITAIDRDKEDKAKASAELKRLSEAADGFTAEERSRLWAALAACAKKVGDLDLAQELCRKAADSDPTNLRLRVFLFEIAQTKKDGQAMASAIKNIRKIEQEGPLWHYYEAVRLVSEQDKDSEEKRLDSALAHLAESKILRPDWDRAPMLAGKIQLRQGNKEAALNSLTDAVDKGSRDPQGIGALVNLLYEQGRNDEAQRYIKLLEDQNVELSAHTQRLQAQDMFMRGELEEGLENFQQIAENSDDFRDHLNLGQIQTSFYQKAKLAGKTDRANEFLEGAEKSFRKAAQLAPDEAAVWLAQVQLYNRAENESAALQVISDARKTVSEKHLPLVLARCFQGLGRNLEAQQQFLKAVANSDGKDHAARLLADFYFRNKKVDDAEKLLKRMIDGEQKATASDVAWARRRMGAILYSKSGLPNRRDAIALVDKNLDESPDSEEDIRMKAKLLATFSNKKDRKESAKLLEKLISRPNPNPDDRFLMANVLLAENDWPGVTRQMQRLLAMKDVKPAWLQFYVNALINRNELGDANAYLKRLERLEPDNNAVIRFNAILLARRGQYKQLIEALDKYALASPKNGSTPLSEKELDRLKTVRLVNAATVLEEIIETLPATESGSDPKKIEAARILTDKAEQYWRKIVDLHPEGELRLVRFLSNHGKRDEALSMAETAWQKGKPASIATTVVSLIFTGEATPAQVSRVERILNDATLTFGETNSLTLALAELRSIQRRYEDAESLYRKVLEKDPRNVVALNNLAVFLSLRNIKQDEALEKMNQAITIAGPKPTLLDSRASVYLSRGEWQKAIDDLDTAISGKPTATRFFHQAQAYEIGKNKTKAKAAFQKALNLGLKEDALQPLERPAYRKLRGALK